MCRIKTFLWSLSVRDQQPMGFVVPASCFCSNTQSTRLSQISVSRVYFLLLLGTAYTSGEIRFSISISKVPSHSSVSVPICLACDLQSLLESADAFLAKLLRKLLRTMQVTTNGINSLTAVGTCYFRMA